MLNTEQWKCFELNELFDIEAGIYHYPDEYEEGTTPYVSATNLNNGIKEYINLSPDFRRNCIVTGKVGCTAFYQSEDFCATSDVNIFRPKVFNLNKEIGLFIVTVINFSENYKWNYGRQCRVGDSKKIKIKLPALMQKGNFIIDSKKVFSKHGFVPDFDYMEKYTQNIEKIKRKNINSFEDAIKTSKHRDLSFILDTTSWSNFKISDIFEVKYGINIDLIQCEITDEFDENSVNYVSRTSSNNGVSARVKIIDGIQPQHSGVITCAGGGSVLSTFLQKEPFYSGRDLYLLIPKFDMSTESKLFCITVIEANKYRFNYGRQANTTLPNLELRLPALNNQPDFTLMSNYILKTSYGDKVF